MRRGRRDAPDSSALLLQQLVLRGERCVKATGSSWPQWCMSRARGAGRSIGVQAVRGALSVENLSTIERLSDFTFTFHFHALEKEMTTHSSVLAWRIPGKGEPGAWRTLSSWKSLVYY